LWEGNEAQCSTQDVGFVDLFMCNELLNDSAVWI